MSSSDAEDASVVSVAADFTLSRGARIALYSTQLLDTFWLTLFIPLYPYVFTSLSGFSQRSSGLLFGLISSAAAFGSFVGNAPLGALSDVWGRRKPVLLATVGGAACLLLTAFAHSVWLLALSRLLGGLFAGTGGVLASYIADCTAQHARPAEMGRLGAMSALGLMLGPALGIALGYSLGVQLGFFVAACTGAAIALINALLVFLFMPESPRFAPGAPPIKRKSCARVLRVSVSRTLLVNYCCTFCNAASIIFLESILPLLLIRSWGFAPWQLIVLYATYLVCGILMQTLVLSRVLMLFSDIRAFLSCAFTVLATTLLVFPVFKSFPVIVCLMAFSSVFMLTGPSMSLFCSLVSQGHHGTVLGVRVSVGSLARGISPLVMGPLYDVRFPPVLPSATTHAFPFLMAAGMLWTAAHVIFLADFTPPARAEQLVEVVADQPKEEKSVN